MKTKIIFTLFIISTFLNKIIFAQAPLISWQNTIGGDQGDYFQTGVQTADGGYIMAGFSYSGISVDKQEAALGNSDYWVVKTNSAGNIEWENTIGGSGYDDVYSIKQTPDGGYILGGRSSSGISADKSEASIPGGIYGYDYWVIKLNALGIIEWENTIGGNDEDNLWAVSLTSDGGYILGGYSASGISGDKTEASIGGLDYWIVKLNATGDIVWQNTIGGSNTDYLTCVEQTTDGGYILGGYSISGISGDKSEFSQGVYDYWIIKLNSAGGITWQNTIGGLSSEYLRAIHQTADGGYILGGPSGSPASGDKTEPSYDGGLYKDYWIVKLNSGGSIAWQNTIGGSGDDVLTSIQQTPDGGYIIGGYSTTGISGDKTEASMGSYDYWILKLNTSGLIEWQSGIGGSSTDYLNAISQTADGGYIAGGFSFSGISGDKTENSLGSNDFWIIKLQGACIPSTEVCNALDDNCNGIIDEGVVESISISASGATTFCQGSNVILNAIYSGTSIQWKRNGTNIIGATSASYLAVKSGMYTCETNSACGTALSSSINITVNKNPTATISAGGATTFCAGGSVVLTANSGIGLSYQWYRGATFLAGANTINYTATIAGNYKCLVTKIATGCLKYSNKIAVTVPCREGEEEIFIGGGIINIFPNPVDENINVELNGIISASFQILNINGQILYSGTLTTENNRINVDYLSAGMYFIQIQTDSGITMKQFFKE